MSDRPIDDPGQQPEIVKGPQRAVLQRQARIQPDIPQAQPDLGPPQQVGAHPLPNVQPALGVRPNRAVPNVQAQRRQGLNPGAQRAQQNVPLPANNAGPPLPLNAGPLAGNIPLPLPPLPLAGAQPINAGLPPAQNMAPILVNPVPVRPMPMGPVGGMGQLDVGVPQVQRRWSQNVMAALGLRSNASRDRVMASTVATAARVDETSFQPGQGPVCAATLHGGVQPTDDADYLALIYAVDAFEKAPLPRGQAVTDALRQAALTAQPSVQAEPRCKAAVDKILEQLRPYDLRDNVLALGSPANWTSAQAAQASSAKVELDLLSLANPQAVSLGADAGVNASFWIKKTGGTGTEDRSYICKPMSDHSEVNGIPAGGEVAREALAARAAEAIGRQTGLQIPIPETHVIALDAPFLPGNVPVGASGKVTSSVQEVRPCQGPVKGTPLNVLAQVPPAQCQAIAIADTIMLNVDRHYGNMLMDGNNIVPIDHGGTFIDPTLDRGRGVDRITQALSTSHNCLLQMPGTHAPLTNHDRANLQQLDPLALTSELMTKRDELEATMPDAMVSAPTMTPKGILQPGPEVMSNAAMELTRRSAEFVKIAAGYRGISAATIQVAMAGAAKILFDLQKTGVQDFAKIANSVLAEALANQAVMREACLLNDMEDAAVGAALEQQGWSSNERGKPPANSIDCDPAFKLKLAAFGVKLDTTIGHGAKPAKKAPKDDRIQEMAAAYPAITRLIEKGPLDKTVAAQEWACSEQLKSADPVALADLTRLGLMSPATPLKPSVILAKLNQLQSARQAVAHAEQTGGGGLDAVKKQVIALKLRAAQGMLRMLRGPVQGVQQAAIIAPARNSDLPALSAANNTLFDLVRQNMRVEIAALLLLGTINVAEEGELRNLVDAGKLDLVEQELIGHGGVRPDSV